MGYYFFSLGCIC